VEGGGNFGKGKRRCGKTYCGMRRGSTTQIAKDDGDKCKKKIKEGGKDHAKDQGGSMGKESKVEGFL